MANKEATQAGSPAVDGTQKRAGTASVAADSTAAPNPKPTTSAKPVEVGTVTVLDPPTPQMAAYDWAKAPLDEALARLANLREEVQNASRIIQQRSSASATAPVKCSVCPGLIPPGRWAQMRTLRDPATGLLNNIYFCSQRCIALHNQKTQGVQAVPR